LDPASLLVTSHFNEHMPELPPEWLAQEHLDRATQACRRDPRGQLDRRVEVVGLEQQVAADRLLDLDEGASWLPPSRDGRL
jgi:hypothetical protein